MLVCLYQTSHINQSRPHSSMILYHQVANNASLFQTRHIYESHPCTSKIFTPPRSSLLQDPHSSNILAPQRSPFINNASLSLSNSSYIYQSRPYSSKILHHQIANNASLFKLLSSNLVSAPPRSSLLQNTTSLKILNHQDTNNAILSLSISSFPQLLSLLLQYLYSSKILKPPISQFAKSSLLKNLQSSSSEQC